MRELKGLGLFLDNYTGMIKANTVAEFMQSQFSVSHLRVYADPLEEEKITLLADLSLQEFSYDAFEQSIIWIFMGTVLDASIPLTYRIDGQQLQFTGRCSVIPKVCGVDLYFSHYQQQQGVRVRQKITVSIRDLVKQLKQRQKTL